MQLPILTALTLFALQVMAMPTLEVMPTKTESVTAANPIEVTLPDEQINYKDLLTKTYLTEINTDVHLLDALKTFAPENLNNQSKQPNRQSTQLGTGLYFVLDDIMKDMYVDTELLQNIHSFIRISEAQSPEQRELTQYIPNTEKKAKEDAILSAGFNQNDYQSATGEELLSNLFNFAIDIVSHPLSIMAAIIFLLIMTPILILRKRQY